MRTVIDLKGKFIVIEGPDNVGRSTHVRYLTQRLEAYGVATGEIGLLRSDLLGGMMKSHSNEVHSLNFLTRSLLYATDLYDQILNKAIPLLEAGFIIVADRYTLTPLIREEVRNGDGSWIESLYQTVPTPDVTIVLDAGPKRQLDRLLYSENLDKLNHFEAGMDMGLDASITKSFLKYQKVIRQTYKKIVEKTDNCYLISTKGRMSEVHDDIWSCVYPYLKDII